MSVSHYETEYKETGYGEYGGRVGSGYDDLVGDERDALPICPACIVDCAHEVVATRMMLADAIGTELDALSDADTKLTTIDRHRCRLIDHLTEMWATERTPQSTFGPGSRNPRLRPKR
jgi:hypothetical protein